VKEVKVQDNNYLDEFLGCLGLENEKNEYDGWVSINRLRYELGL